MSINDGLMVRSQVKRKHTQEKRLTAEQGMEVLQQQLDICTWIDYFVVVQSSNRPDARAVFTQLIRMHVATF